MFKLLRFNVIRVSGKSYSINPRDKACYISCCILIFLTLSMPAFLQCVAYGAAVAALGTGTFDREKNSPVNESTTYETIASTEAIQYMYCRDTYSQPGIYTPNVRFTMPADEVHTGTVTTITIVQNIPDDDAVIRSVWNGMRKALIANDMEKALTYFAPSTREQYRTIFTNLGSNLSSIASKMGDIKNGSLMGTMAEYYITKDERISGQTVTITYSVDFVIDMSGNWKILNY